MALTPEQEAELQKHLQPPTIMDKIRAYALGHKGWGAGDVSEADAANNVDAPPAPVQAMSTGGVVKGVQDLIGASGIPLISDIANGKSLYDSFTPQPNPTPAPAPQPAAPAPVVDAAPAMPAAPDTAVDTEDDDELRKSNPKVASSHPGFNQDELEKYILKEKQGMDKFGPDAQAQAHKDALARADSFGNRANVAGHDIGDAVMMASGHGNPGTAAAAREALKHGVDSSDALNEKLGTENLATQKAKEALDTQSNANPLGASAAEAMMPVLRQMYPNKSDAELMAMSHNPAVAQGLLPEQVKMFDAQKKLEAAKMQKDVALKTHQDQFDEMRLQGLSRSLSADREYTQLRTKQDTLENVGKLIEQVDAQKGAADRRQSMELALAQVRTLIGTGQITEGEVHQMMPQTWRGNVATFLEKVGNQPEGQDGKDFILRAKDFFRRESKLTNMQIDRRYSELSAPFQKVLSRNGDLKQSMDTQFHSRTAQPQPSVTPTVTSQEQYDALPKGAPYQDANGKPHVKGGR